MIDTVIFDIGKVLVGFDPPGYLRRLLGDETAAQRVYDAVFTSGLWDELDRGAEVEELLPMMQALAPGYEDAVRRGVMHIGQTIWMLDYAMDWLQSVRAKGVGVLYLSNYSRHAMCSNWDALRFLPLMDGGVFSCQVRLIKPDRAIYQCLCDRFGVDPARSVFIDDNPANIHAAEEFGLHTIRFQSYEQAAAELDALLN